MLRRCLTAIALSSALAFWGASALAGPIPPAFESLFPILDAQTEVPVLIPADVPVDMFEPNTGAPADLRGAKVGPDGRFATFFPAIAAARPDRYLVVLGFIPDCLAAACDFGSLAGEKLSPGAGEPAEYRDSVRDFQRGFPPVRSPEMPAKVQLLGGEGWFLPYTCAASCGESKVIFDRNGYRFTVGIQQADRQAVIDLANSSIVGTFSR